MKGTYGTQAMLVVCTALLFAACGGGKSGEAAEVAVTEVSGSDLPRAFDVGQPDTSRVTGKDVSADTAREIDLSSNDMADAAEVCIPDCEGMECGDDGCGGSCGDCDDEDVCNGVEQCDSGQCVSGAPLSCDDDGPCTVDECDPVLGCQHTEHEGPCDDGDPCTDGGHCFEGECVPGEPVCFPCKVDLDCVQYDDGNLCNGTVECVAGLCKATADSVICPQPIGPCWLSYCAPETGECLQHPVDDLTACDDGDVCTFNDACKSGECVGQPLDCEDSDLCTVDFCLPGQGCSHDPKECPATKCTLGSCNLADGSCVQESIDCDDGQPCTIDSCDEGTGCQHIDLDCDDGDPCTTDWCNPTAGACQHSPLDCTDGDPCTDDVCHALLGSCLHPPTYPCKCPEMSDCSLNCYTGCCNYASCDDGNPCTCDTLSPGGCWHSPVSCHDHSPCTDDFCNPALVEGDPCVHIPNDVNSCDDGVESTVDQCVDGICVSTETN